MELKHFISETIKQITDGILEGNKYVREKSKSIEGVRDQYTKINFDIGVSVNDEKTNEAGAKIAVAQVINIGGGTSKNSKTTNENRVQFDLMIQVKTSVE